MIAQVMQAGNGGRVLFPVFSFLTRQKYYTNKGGKVRYVGGKKAIAKELAGYINGLGYQELPYWEPFVGMASVIALIENERRYGSDIFEPVIALWQAVQQGWEPPEFVSRRMYERVKRDENYPSELRAFVGFGCSWSGAWFSNYARGKNKYGIERNYAGEAKRALLAIKKHIKNVRFFLADFFTVVPSSVPTLIYCDPPYFETTGYSYLPKFDHMLFYARVQYLAELGHIVLFSEESAPAGFKPVFEVVSDTGLRGNGDNYKRVERLFQWDATAA